jgi:hypothetical protein
VVELEGSWVVFLGRQLKTRVIGGLEKKSEVVEVELLQEVKVA